MVKIKAAVFLFYKTLLNLFWYFFDGSKFSPPAATKRRYLNQFPAAVVNPAAIFLRAKIRQLGEGKKAQLYLNGEAKSSTVKVNLSKSLTI